MLTTKSPFARSIPFTPPAARPIGANFGFAEENGLAVAAGEENHLLAVGQLCADQFICPSRLMAIIPEGRGFENSASSVFFTVPFFVARKT